MSDIEFVIQDNVEIPKREFAGTRVERESQYPIAKMKPGQSFAIGIKGESGTKVTNKDGTETVLTLAESIKRHAAQKQSYFSSLGKRLNVSVVTRFFPNGEPDANGHESGEPTLRVWHDGVRKEKAPKTAKAAAAPVQHVEAAEEEALDL